MFIVRLQLYMCVQDLTFFLERKTKTRCYLGDPTNVCDELAEMLLEVSHDDIFIVLWIILCYLYTYIALWST